MIILIIIVISIGGLVQIVPLFFQDSLTEPVAGLKPYDPLRLEGRDIYVREGCYVCHSQMIRPFRAETERYGHYSVAGEHVYVHGVDGSLLCLELATGRVVWRRDTTAEFEVGNDFFGKRHNFGGV